MWLIIWLKNRATFASVPSNAACIGGRPHRVCGVHTPGPHIGKGSTIRRVAPPSWVSLLCPEGHPMLLSLTCLAGGWSNSRTTSHIDDGGPLGVRDPSLVVGAAFSLNLGLAKWTLLPDPGPGPLVLCQLSGRSPPGTQGCQDEASRKLASPNRSLSMSKVDAPSPVE